MSKRPGFSVLELLVVLLVGVMVFALWLPSQADGRRTARQMQNSTQARGVHQSFVIYAQGNKQGGGDGWYPALDKRGKVAAAPAVGPDQWGGQVGAPSAVFALLLNGDFFTPEYAVNPADTNVWAVGHEDERVDLVPPDDQAEEVGHFSYALLDFGGIDRFGQSLGVGADPMYPHRAGEWRETLNTMAVVLGDRNTGADAELGSQISSVWTSPNEGAWRGTLARNDGSTAFETTPIQEDLRYGRAPVLAKDHVYKTARHRGADVAEDGTQDADAMLIVGGVRVMLD